MIIAVNLNYSETNNSCSSSNGNTMQQLLHASICQSLFKYFLWSGTPTCSRVKSKSMLTDSEAYVLIPKLPHRD